MSTRNLFSVLNTDVADWIWDKILTAPSEETIELSHNTLRSEEFSEGLKHLNNVLLTSINNQSEGRLTFSDWGEDVQTGPTYDLLTLPFSGQHLQTDRYGNTASQLVQNQQHRSNQLLLNFKLTSCRTICSSKRCVSRRPLGPTVWTNSSTERRGSVGFCDIYDVKCTNHFFDDFCHQSVLWRSDLPGLERRRPDCSVRCCWTSPSPAGLQPPVTSPLQQRRLLDKTPVTANWVTL